VPVAPGNGQPQQQQDHAHRERQQVQAQLESDGTRHHGVDAGHGNQAKNDTDRQAVQQGRVLLRRRNNPDKPDTERTREQGHEKGHRIVQGRHFGPEQHPADAGDARLPQDHGQHVDRIGTEPPIAIHQRVGQCHKNRQRGQAEIGAQKKLRALLLVGRDHLGL
jgi:hypothetical protein